MIEQDPYYIKHGEKRLEQVVPEIGDVEKAVFDIKPIKVSVVQMVENSYLFLGETFFHKNGEQAKLVNEKGILSYKGIEASMHEIAAKMMNGNRRVNAFDYLFVSRGGVLVSIAEVRDKFRQTI